MINPGLCNFFYDSQKGWVNGTTVFINTIKSRCNLNSVVLDLGAGSGLGKPLNYSLKGLVKSCVGADNDKDLSKNQFLDKKVLADIFTLPFRRETFDLVYTDYVLEHIDRPGEFVKEVRRVIKRGGFFIFRTPNLYHYIPLTGRLIPKQRRRALINFVNKFRDKDFCTFYKMNTVGKLKKLFLGNGFSLERLELIEKEPSYLMFNNLAFLTGVLYERIVNSTQLLSFLRINIIGVFRKC